MPAKRKRVSTTNMKPGAKAFGAKKGAKPRRPRAPKLPGRPKPRGY